MPGRLPRRQKQNRKLSHRSITASLSWLTVVTFAAKAIPPCSSVDPVVPAFRVLSDLCGESRFPVFLRGPRGSSFRVLSDLCGKSGSPLFLSLIHISEPTRLLSISYAVF